MHLTFRDSLIAKVRHRFDSIGKPLFLVGVNGAVRRLWEFLTSNPQLNAILSEAGAANQEIYPGKAWMDVADGEQSVEKTLAKRKGYVRFLYDSFRMAYEAAVREEDQQAASNGSELIDQEIGRTCLEHLRDIAPHFRDYFVECLEEQQCLLVAIVRYKERCEWFHRKQLNDQAKSSAGDDTKTGQVETTLKYDLYGYLHDQGCSFFIEPKVGRGIPDLCIDQVGSDSIIADAKIFDDSKSAASLKSAVNQVVQYLQRANTVTGYLIVFRLSDHMFEWINVPYLGKFPVIPMAGKRVVVVEIDICDYDGKRPSQMGPPRVIQVSFADCRSDEHNRSHSGGEEKGPL